MTRARWIVAISICLAPADAATLQEIRITGLRNTREEVIRQFIQVNPGESIAKLNPQEIVENIERLRIFSKVELELQELSGQPCSDQCRLTIRVKEKWSLYPIPVYVKYRDTEIGGAFLVESNLFGRNQGGAIGALISNRGWQALLGFTDPHIAFTRFSTSARYLTGRVFIEDATPQGVIQRSYTLMRHDFQSATGYTWNNLIFAGALLGYRSAEVTDNSGVPSANVLNGGLRLKISNVLPHNFFQVGLESTLDTEKGIALRGEDLHVVSSASAWHINTFQQHYLSLLLSFQYSHYPDPLEQRLGGWQGTRTLPALLVPADKFIVSAVNYQVGILNFPWATFAALAFFDLGSARRDGSSAVYFYGPGAGFRMYLSEITIPALGIDLARDLPSEAFQLSFFLGYNLQ